ncbi:hypothetical protein KUTeg_004012 [Tegillarca granosa]|uniref:SOCS box domain-containing protein n=1 Tax=Tegillarca granosa TaxID=220873 RepID=A0ABQ9FNQ7_TEGGR|nr:hypothetical protein KUTeg_004012 [Tegillarca granosa]
MSEVSESFRAEDIHLFVQHKYPLHKAAQEGRHDIIETLINSGHSVNVSNYDLVTPLHEACFHGKQQCVKALLQHGAEVNSRNIDGATPLCDAASSGNVECVEILFQYGANVNPPLLLSSPLHEAVLRDQWQCVQLLIENGANLNISDCHYGTPLHTAGTLGFTHSAELLLKAGADVNAIKTHNTALHIAAHSQDYKMVTLLLRFGASTNAENNSGYRPVELVTSSTSPVKQVLLHWQGNVRRLKELCRFVIRKNINPTRLSLIDQLQLPKLLIEYLKFNV